MLVRWSVVLKSLLITAVIGCQSALPLSPNSTNRRWKTDSDLPRISPTKTQSSIEFQRTRLENVKPISASFEQILDSQEPATLTDLEKIAFQNNPTLAAAAARVKAARGRQVQAGLFPNPMVGYHATQVGNQGTTGQQGGFVSQRFVTGGKLQLDQAIAGKTIDEAHFLFHSQQQRVLSDVRIRFYDVLVTQRQVVLTQELAQIGDDLVAATEKLVQGRLGTQNELLQAQIQADESHILHDNARNQDIEAWRRLTTVVGLPTMQKRPLVGHLDSELPYLDWDSCHTALLHCNPELMAARARTDQACLGIRRARREPIPNVDVSVSIRHSEITQSDVANIQVGLPIPIFNKNEGAIRAAEAEWIAASHEVKRLELELYDRLAVAYRRYTNARQQLERYRKRMVPRAERSLQLVTEGYEKGQVKYLTLLTAQQTYLQVNLSYYDSLQEHRTASALIEGQLLSGSLTNRQSLTTENNIANRPRQRYNVRERLPNG